MGGVSHGTFLRFLGFSGMQVGAASWCTATKFIVIARVLMIYFVFKLKCFKSISYFDWSRTVLVVNAFTLRLNLILQETMRCEVTLPKGLYASQFVQLFSHFLLMSMYSRVE